MNERGKVLSVLYLVLAIIFVLLIIQIYQYQHSSEINEEIKKMLTSSEVDNKEQVFNSPELQFAFAYNQHRRMLFENAVDAYGHAERLADASVKPLVHYNLGNLYLQFALKEAEKGGRGIDRAMALADSAKEMYRLSLTADPDYFPAKYNYEAAQRISRDLPLNESISNDADDVEGSEELWSAMPGFPIGLP